MGVTAVVGAQWGDEGKGRIVDVLAGTADLVVRFQGGDNAGHTVVNDLGTFKLHLLPSGIFRPHTTCIIGAGCVVHPGALLQEMDRVRAAGVALDGLRISTRAHLVLPYHRLLDEAEEEARGQRAIGTTARGIGPAYSDKAARVGVRAGDLRRPDYLRERLGPALERANARLQALGVAGVALDPLLAQCADWANRLAPYLVDTLPLLRTAVRAGRSVLLEGQLGAMRDLDWGIYPYVTSSNPLAGYAAVGAGLPPLALTRVLGVAKVYSTAVGAGPFPVELEDATGERLRTLGDEYGATTGRPRRCGWFDAVAVRHAAWLDGLTGLALTKLDVLDTFDEVKVCVAYRLDGETIDTMPDTPDLLRVQPVYETLPGWRTSTTGVRTWDGLPAAARAFLLRLSELADVPIDLVSVGPAREQLVVLRAGGATA